MQQLRGDDESVARTAFATLFLRYTPRVFASMLHGVSANNPPAAEDAVQAVMIRLWERRTELPPIDNLLAYLIRATARECFAMHRAERRAVAREASVAEDDAIAFGEIASDATLVEDELRTALRDAIDTIPGRTGTLFRAWYTSGATYESVARQFGVSTQAVVQARLRTIAQLRDHPRLATFFKNF